MPLLQKAYLGSTALFKDTDWFEDGAAKLVDATAAGFTIGVSVQADTNAHTKGAWTEIIASTSANASLLHVWVAGLALSNTNTATLIDIGTGASGSETSVVSNVAVGCASNETSGSTFAGGIEFCVPLKIPSGTRISARIQSVVTGGETARVAMYVLDAGDYDSAPTSVDTIGADTANSKGISCSGASGTWVEAIASTSQAYRAVVFVPSSSQPTNANTIVRFDIGIGASGNENAFGFVETIYSSGEAVTTSRPSLILFGKPIPSGSRLAVRHTRATSPERSDFVLIGIP